MDGQNLKNGFSNKKRVMCICSAIVLTAIPIFCLAIDVPNKMEVIILLIAMLAYCVYIYFLVFKTYISLNCEKRKIIVREYPGFKKEELDLFYVREIKFSDGILEKNLYTIDIIYNGYTKKIKSWSSHFGQRLAVFNSYNRQKNDY